MINLLLPYENKIHLSNNLNNKFQTIILILILTFSLTMRLNIIHHNVRNWGHYKHDLSNHYLKHNPDIISINSHGLSSNNNQFLKIQYFPIPISPLALALILV